MVWLGVRRVASLADGDVGIGADISSVSKFTAECTALYGLAVRATTG